MKQKSLSFDAFVQDKHGKYMMTRPMDERELFNHVAAILETRMTGVELTNPTAAADFLRLRLAPLEHEVFGCLFLDTRHRVLAFEVMFRGTIDSATVHPREVVKAALTRNAAAVILSHNHPSGFAEPSSADGAITRRLVEALALVDVRVLDHIVVGTEGTVSMAARGLL
jgi:DNA repair protein RadC